MDKSTRPGESDGGGSEQDFGATGIFGTAKASDGDGRSASPGGAPDALRNRASQIIQSQAAVPQPPPAERVLPEPAVRKVVFGGVAAERSPELLDQMRMASAAREREATAEKAAPSEPEIPSSGQSSGGFTQLLRKLGTAEAPPPPPAASEMPATPPLHPAQDMGFTSLLQKLGASDAPATSPADPHIDRSSEQPYAQRAIARPVADETRTFAPAPESGSLTDMFRAMPGAGSASVSASGSGLSSAETQVLRPGAAPAATRPDLAQPAVAASAAPVKTPESSPGAFTKLFETFAATEADSTAAAPAERASEAPLGEPGSFTRMLAMEPQSQAPKPPPQFQRELASGKLDYGLAPGTANPSGATAPVRDPFSPAPPADVQPSQGSLQASGVGITRLISMLDQPAQAPTPVRNAAPMSTPPTGGGDGFTATFAAFDSSSESGTPAAKQPAWMPTQAARSAPGATGAVASRRDEFGGSPTQPAMNTPQSGAGPSEFTRIMDASKMREQSMRAGPGAASGAPGSSAPSPTTASGSMPGFQVPPAPATPRMPQPGAYVPQPPQVPGYPMNYGPQGGAMHPPGGSAPQMPGLYPPAPPQMPAAPQLPPLKPAEPGLGKLQQYVPMLLVVIIVLLVALIVTVIFLMKH